ncbi:MAG: ATP-binding protein [Chloroflexota bacterium]
MVGVFKLSGSHGKAATQRCPCGFYGDSVKECSCSPSVVARYQKRISGPLLDGIDIC